MTERQRWLAARRKHIGSSDSPAILGVDPFRSATEVYWSKLAELPDEEKPQFEMGRRLEDVICEWAADRLQVKITRNVFRVSEWGDGGIMAATFDALVDGERAAFEAKFSSQASEWGEEGTDQVPERVLVQAQHQMHVGDLELVWVPALIIGYTAQFRLYVVKRHEELMTEIARRDVEFWRTYVETQTPPDGWTVPPLAALKVVRREPNSIVELGDDAVKAWEALQTAKAILKENEEGKDRLQARVLELLGDAEAGRLPDGRLITYLEQKSAPRCDTAQLRACHPEIYERFFDHRSHRVLRIKDAHTRKEH